ncbi:MAG: S8 family serine peptidase [Candidatus Lokiarchaeota archaeon]|nr:S8 family serine peptidase [Candidatus Lokiarchaeota archaeon]
MYIRKHKILSLFLISLLFLSTLEFTKIPFNLNQLITTNSKTNLKKDSNYLVQNLNVIEQNIESKISLDVMRRIELHPNDPLEVILYLKNNFSNSEYRELELKDNNLPINEFRSLLYEKSIEKNQPVINAVIDQINNLNGSVISISKLANALLISVKAQKVLQIAGSSLIKKIEMNYKIETRLDDSVPTITEYFGSNPSFQWDYTNYNGSGIRVAVVDTGINKSHPALTGKVIQEKDFTGGSNPNDSDGHGTHVAGIVASTDPIYQGVAPGVDLINIKVLNSFGSGNSFDVIEGVSWALIENDFNISIITMSAGASVEANGTNGFACFVDDIVKHYNVIWCIAAGNRGPSSKSIDVPGDAYNGITVGNIDDNGNIDRSDDSISSSSSRGPTWDIERVKPDITAPGTSIISLNNELPHYSTKSGTSMATPHIAGCAALLWQYYKENPVPGISEVYYPLLIKSILLHTASDKGTNGADFSYGQGYVDMVSVNKFIDYGNAMKDSFENFGSSIFKYKINIDKNTEFNLSLLWEKEATYDVVNHMYTGWQENAITNLNVYLENSNFQTLTSSASLYDNYEYLEYNCSPGIYYIKIEVKNRALYASPEDFLVISSAPFEKIFWVDAFTILFTVLIIGIIVAIVILVVYYIKSRGKEKEEVEFGYSPSDTDDFY